ncbi:MAG: MoxR family ATPase [Acidobacteriota bacterium]|nr:MoxR family ATPase [Acidobacteriota bacterium]
MHVHVKRTIDAGGSLTASVAARLEEAIEHVVIGQEEAVHDALIAVLAGGHCLFLGPSGVGKSLMGSAVARALSQPFVEVAATPDARDDRLPEGGVIVISEIARAATAVRVALLDQSPAGSTIFATHNPFDPAGSPLTDAEFDRIMLATRFDYPTAEEERALLRRPETLRAAVVIEADELLRARAEVAGVPAASNVIEYAARLARSTRPVHDGEAPAFVHDLVVSGAGPRGALALMAAARAHALIDGAAAVSLDDVDAVAPAALRHRIRLSDAARRQGLSTDDVISRIIPLARK